VPVLSLAPGRGSGAVSIAAFDGAGAELATSTVELPAGLTTTYDPGRRLARAAVRNAAYLVLAPRGAAPVQAAATYTSSRGGVSVLPLSTPPTTVLAPAAVPAGG
jgi:hypothetical protein